MILSERIPIARKDGITIYGRVIGLGGKLGRYEVYSENTKNDGNVYLSFAEAERRMESLQHSEGKRTK